MIQLNIIPITIGFKAVLQNQYFFGLQCLYFSFLEPNYVLYCKIKKLQMKNVNIMTLCERNYFQPN